MDGFKELQTWSNAHNYMSEASPEEARSEETNFGVTGTNEETASYDPIILYHRACELG
ncbi:uncharacterized protein FTOL_01354 [Fusarium torulosum]|uniref:Uncharacterized protein n=1 Tax=Fusarium torulosum TaxID=33205 RepID=A0AAE8SDM2_9HYPO|nr:uncharacterized protein FTOL_01354 [Fusarium torulosum]